MNRTVIWAFARKEENLRATFNVKEEGEVMSDPLRRNLLRKGRCCRFLLRRWNLLTFLILLKFHKALSRCMSAHEAVSVTGKDDYPWVNYSHCDVSL